MAGTLLRLNLRSGAALVSLFPAPCGSPGLHTSQSLPQDQVGNVAAKPWSEIPRTETTSEGLNTDLMNNPLRLNEYLQDQTRKLGFLFRPKGVPGLPKSVYAVAPEDVEAVYRAGDRGYPRRFPFDMWKAARKDLNLPIGMFFEEGEEWMKQRLPISKFIMMPQKMAKYYEQFNDITLDYIDYLRKHRHEDGMSEDYVESLNKWSLESISQFILGKRIGCLEDEIPPECREFMDSIKHFLESTLKIIFGLPQQKAGAYEMMVNEHRKSMLFCQKIVKEKVQEIREDHTEHRELGEDDFLTYMMHSGQIDVDILTVNAMDLLSAGLDTTSISMAACFYCLGNNPEAQEKLREEVMRVVGQEPLVNLQHIQDMHYLRNTIKEAMRLFPAIPMNSRILEEDIVLSGYTVPAGVTISMPRFVIGRLAEYFNEPDSFRPERWTRGDEEPALHSFASVPFSYGRRSCVGRRVAELEMHILLAQMMRNFRIEYCDDKPMEFVYKLFLYPARPLNFKLVDVK